MYTFTVISHSCFYELFNSVVYLIGPRACQRSHIWQIPLQSDRRGKLCQGSQSTPCCVSAFHQTSPLPETVHRRFPPCYSQSPLQPLPWDFCFLKLMQHLPISTVHWVPLLYTVKEKGGKPDRKPHPALPNVHSWIRLHPRIKTFSNVLHVPIFHKFRNLVLVFPLICVYCRKKYKKISLSYCK